MRVHIQPVRRPEELLRLLRRGGWKLEEAGADRWTATHPQAADQSTARSLLHRLGLLTSAGLRIEFGLRGGEGRPAAGGTS
jgi:hypothetical protein